jgi:hypothetical protein
MDTREKSMCPLGLGSYAGARPSMPATACPKGRGKTAPHATVRPTNRSITLAAWMLPCLLAVLLSGCNGSNAGTAAQTQPTVSTPTHSARPSDHTLVHAVDLRPGDLPAKYGSKNVFGARGDRVVGYVTMDMCGAYFASEALRTARHQVGYVAPDHDSISSETVAYGSGGAARAMRELRHAIATCPKGSVGSSVAGQPSQKERIEQLPRKSGWQHDKVAIRLTVTPSQGSSETGALVYQRRGNLITAAYVWAGRQASAGLASRMASLLSGRLEAAVQSAGTTS